MMNTQEMDRMNDLATKIIEGVIRPEEEQEFVQLYNLHMESRNESDKQVA